MSLTVSSRSRRARAHASRSQTSRRLPAPITATSRPSPACSSSLRGQHHAPGGVELDLVGVGVEEALEAHVVARERMDARRAGRRRGALKSSRTRSRCSARVALERDDDAVGERLAQLRRDREPVLDVEGVVVGSRGTPLQVRHERSRTGLEEAGGTHPPRFAAGTVPGLLPLCNTNRHKCFPIPHFASTTGHAHPDTARSPAKTGAMRGPAGTAVAGAGALGRTRNRPAQPRRGRVLAGRPATRSARCVARRPARTHPGAPIGRVHWASGTSPRGERKHAGQAPMQEIRL